MAAIAKWIRHNQGVFFAIVIMAGLAIWTYGCEPTTRSILEPDRKVNAVELELEIERETARIEAELDRIIKTAELRREDILRKQKLREKITEFAMLSVQAGTVNPTGVVSLLVSILGIGAVIDNRIKDKVIKNRPLKEEA